MTQIKQISTDFYQRKSAKSVLSVFHRLERRPSGQAEGMMTLIKQIPTDFYQRKSAKSVLSVCHRLERG